ncbi:MAG TPA: tripartite tricarboxylate transporter substrate binding protein [Ramlibacter sp.]|uniref:Bug family tripartite tricarboxylate transporter substrate binding protein n=1 Tax=Ramlibacter sp. TaxID=1917967 RepID=UPI002ED4591D
MKRLLAGLAVAASTLVSLPAQADLSRMEILVPSGVGGGWDQTGRALQQALRTEKVSSNVQVTNVPGAGGTIGLAQFITTKKGRPNALLIGGFTLVSAAITNKSAVSLANVTPIARLTGEYEILVVPATSPIRNLGDLVAKLKAEPRSVSWAGGSAGSTDHVLAALVGEAVGVDASKVNYVAHAGGGEAMTSILGGHVTVGIGGWNEYEAQIKDGKLRAIGVAAPKRLPGIDVPTFREQGVPVELANWRGVFAPPGIPDAEAKALSAALEKLARSDTWKKMRDERGWLDYYMPRAEFEKYIAGQQVQMQKTLTTLGLAK